MLLTQSMTNVVFGVDLGTQGRFYEAGGLIKNYALILEPFSGNNSEVPKYFDLVS